VQDADGADVIRPYTPVSTNAMLGQFELLVKIYPGGKLSQHLDKMEVGKPMEFKHIEKNVKIQYPFKPKIGMLVGGTGITPMIQALHAILGTESDGSSVSMLYGCRTVDDILGRETLDDWSSSHTRFAVMHVLSSEAEGSSWQGLRGFVTKELIEKHLPPPSDDCIIMVCGPPPMYNALCGPRDAAELTGALAELGYKPEQVFKF
jgi:cytochrome-b5 reductase